MSEGAIDEEPGTKGKVDAALKMLAADVRLVRYLHIGAVVATVVPVLILLLLLIVMVFSFGSHLVGSTGFLKSAVTQSSIGAEDQGHEANPGHFRKLALPLKDEEKVAKEAKDAKDEKAKSDEASKSLSDQAHLYAMISSYQTSLSTSSVAIISILVIAVTVISVAMLKGALGVKPYEPPRESEVKAEVNVEPTEPEKDHGFILPIWEFTKHGFDAIKSFFGGKKSG